MEIWRDIKGYEGRYQVSSKGKIKRVKHATKNKIFPERLKKTGIDKDGYITVMLYNGRNKKLCKVHRLVGEAFIENPHNKPMINHIDENRSNNNVENLEWCDCIYNNNYGTRNKRLSESKRKAHVCYCYHRDKHGKFAKGAEL